MCDTEKKLTAHWSNNNTKYILSTLKQQQHNIFITAKQINKYTNAKHATTYNT